MSIGPRLTVVGGAEGAGGPDRVVTGRYRLAVALGRGGMGTVWRAEDLMLGRDVAVKELTFPPGATAAEREVLRERMRREARAAAQLDHPGLVTVHDVVEDGATTYLVLQYVPARTLTEVVEQDGPLSPQETARLGLALLEALGAAHERGIVHRDVKPSNVLVTGRDGASGRVLLTDFGIASVPGQDGLTATGMLVGSPGYMSPERARGGDAGPASDLWSLGATLFTAVEGRPPFEGPDAVTTLARVVFGEHAPYRRAGPLPPVLEGLLDRDPTARTTAAAAERALAAVAATPERTEAEAASPPPGAVAPDAPARTALLHREADLPTGAGGTSTDGLRVVVAPRRAGGRRARRLAAAGLVVVAVVGALLALVLTRTGSTPTGAAPADADPPAAVLPALPADADTPDEQLDATVTAVEEALASDPGSVGTVADQLVTGLREVQQRDGPARRWAALFASDATAAAATEGTLAPAVADRVRQVLAEVARPDRLVDLVETVGHDRQTLGPAGPRLFDALVALDHDVPADQTADRAAALVTDVTDAAAAGEIGGTLRDVALPLLRELADPRPQQALRALLDDVERDPGQVGPAADEVLVSLRAAAELPVFEQGAEVGGLLALLRDQGRVTAAFRDEAVPVLTPLVR
ncbi:Serine/threonine protein kinase [Geodermatophilus dictyosporus]|uniref:non-specific serine/threonine protein kinase n=1 Tax=Geodermatophilus dictyosporus TaxID=1523247 RepID=A0A1I5QJ46_9ACTN|nr:serine/threonine-protein kinase [Geodermatophilus dictyosporus]SFP46070.1 Serine/threonine protein kinase [Geodermatophilus dictyosporus]